MQLIRGLLIFITREFEQGNYAMNFPIIQENTGLEQAVDAKDLHQALGLHPAKWSEWSKNNIVKNPFALEGTDYLVYNPKLNTFGGRPTTDYLLSIDFAKKLAMQVRTEKGEQVRSYFLDCERKAINTGQPVMPALPNFTNPADAAIAWAEEYRAKEAAQAQVIELKPKAEALARISHSQGSLGIREAAKALGMGQNAFVDWCIDENKAVSARFMYRDEFTGRLNAYSHRLKQGFITQYMDYFIDRSGIDRAKPKIKFTPAGVAKIAEMMQKERSREVELG